MSTSMPSTTPDHAPKESVKETLISIIIAFVLAFVFRGFVIEAFVIPTGSMAPTLLGQHMRFTGPHSGRQWAVGPWYYPNPSDTQSPAPIQGPVSVHDPMSGDRIEDNAVPIRSGDRILVLKYLYALREPHRFDVVVFKNPEDPSDNFIKRLIGLAGEQLALVDGDVFYRTPEPGESPPSSSPLEAAPLWERTDWHIARKPPDVARAVWQCIFDSAFTPVSTREFDHPFVPPWVGESPAAPSLASKDWHIAGRRSYEFRGNAAGVLRWNSQATFYADTDPRSKRTFALPWAIDDRYAYDELPLSRMPPAFPVSDLRLRAGFEPASTQPLAVSALINARGHQFRARIENQHAFVEMRAAPAPGEDTPWQVLGQGDASLPAGTITDVEFWHIDQSLQLWVAGVLVAHGEYNWSPAQRILAATGRPLRSLIDPNDPQRRNGIGLTLPDNYRPPTVEWRVSAPVNMYRVALDRDLHYRPDSRGSSPGWATNPATTITLTKDEFFVCGDNSPQSRDGRLWSDPEPWVAKLVDDKPGIVPRRLMLGKAFFVYFPALAGSSPIPMPDFGRLRFIR